VSARSAPRWRTGRVPRSRGLRAGGRILLRRLVVLAALAAALVAGYTFWLRDSGLVAVENVTIEGLSGKDAPRVRAALTAAARDTTTLHLDRAAIARAVAGYPAVASIVVEPDFPHGVTIHVNQRAAAALVVAGGREIPTAADGTFLPDAGGRRLPRIELGRAPSAARLGPGTARAAAAIAGAIPPALAGRVQTLESDGARGVVVPLEDGPELVFGSGVRARAKWAAAARVLADPDADGAAYIDVRIPERPAAGGLPVDTVDPVAPADATAPETSAPTAGQQATPPAAQPQQAAPVAPRQVAPQGPVTPPAGSGGGATPNAQP
jgi:cell division protein FtsQ